MDRFRSASTRTTRHFSPPARLVLSGVALFLMAAAPALPPTPTGVRKILFARAFALDEGFRYGWSAGHPVVWEGWMLVIEADPALVRSRETAEPILYVGRFPAQRVSRSRGSDRLVVLVPAKVDLETEPVWFGAPGLPEQVGEDTASAERRRAITVGIAPMGRGALSVARARGGPDARYASKVELFSALRALVEEYVDAAENPR